ncbi:BREX system P-loop protein BrxC [Kribbella sp. VKM Ac-2566]|uniref:BREX system P-loop protein BrxC n=1 Tax=Kribbella sp. VKM Ac-2566 TaxID=2512218 RepID=UPI0010EDCEF2|nr:BREX system P-loop protein BrxC [Kribbella sp. VKM Ac-2566]TDW98259.1 hypothetical protein EV647_2965 [Kribbella sp. VKM Ac-2566]
MKISEIFRHDLDREIKEVIKVDDPDLDDLAAELQEYVVTNHIHDALVEVLDEYQESIKKPSESVNAWISGFFGSGKSSFAKVLGYVLANPVLGTTTAARLLTSKLDTTTIHALLNTIHNEAPTLSIFVDLSSSRNVAKEGESIVLPLYRELLSRLDYARNFELAELEYTLEDDGRLDDFVAAFERANKRTWKERRDVALAKNEASKALHELDPSTYPNADSWARTKPEVEVTANWFADRALNMLSRRGPAKSRVVFIVDEVGQYVSRSVQRMLDLQGFAQACQKKDGRLWLIATGQETLEDVVGSLGDKRVELARVRDRFPLTVDLVPSDIEEVVSKRVLAKNPAGAQAVRDLYDRYQNQLRSNVALQSATRGSDFTGDEFTRVYPLVPYQVQLFIDAVSALRAVGGAGPMVGGANRTLIRLAHQLVKTALANQDVGALATVPKAYDLMDEMIPTAWRGEIDQIAHRHPDSTLMVEVSKAIALTSNVRALKLDDHNLAVLTHPSVDAETNRPAVKDALAILVSEEAIREGEDGYRLQSPQEKDWEKARRSREMKSGDFNRLLRDRHLKDMLRGLTASAAREFKVQVFYDDDKLLDGDVTLRIYEGAEDQSDRAVTRSREEAHQDDVFLVFARGDKTWRDAEEVFRSSEAIKEAEARSLDSSETELLHEERKRLDRAVRRFERSLREDLLSGVIVFRGNRQPLDGQDLRPALAKSMAERVSEIYTRLSEFAAPVSRTDALSILRSDDLAGLPDRLGPDGLGVLKLEADGYKIDEDGPVADFVRIANERADYGHEATGKYLESRFQGPPYGAEVDVVLILAAAAVRAGLLSVTHGGVRLTARTDARLDQVLSTLPKFRSASFTPPATGVDAETRVRVAKLLHHDLIGEKPPVATGELATFARRRLEDDRENVLHLSAVLTGMQIPLPESVARAASTLRRVRTEQDDDALILALDIGRADLKDGVLAARSIRGLIDDESNLATLSAARGELVVAGGDLPAVAREARDTSREILDSAAWAERFAELRGAVETVRTARAERWEEARRELDEAMSAAREQAGLLLDQVTDAARAEFETSLRAMAVPDNADVGTGPSRETMMARVGRLPQLVNDLRASVGRDTPTRQVRIVELYTEPVRSEAELTALLARVRQAAEEALDAGEYFLLI